jgi:hypothetical protein
MSINETSEIRELFQEFNIEKIDTNYVLALNLALQCEW